ncbi:helix-turn-helix domain-containing protein [Niallia circulans]|uniref:Helix-turn-helix transcriptional regulator n=1 Tax=Niallia circulans TaxID=1397 RepID=A0A941JH43_NIACI|nr:helix-turn-helix transcriptional regulator [Niallia circulans]MCB5235475.1 helix-turn-helix transcriptional regulator [Niallia circulans]
MAIKNNLNVLMAKKGIRSYSEMSRRTGYHYATVRHFSMGLHKRVDTGLIESLCSVLECDLKDLLYIEKKNA